VIAVQNGWKHQMAAAYPDALPTLTKEEGSSGIEMLKFAQTESMWSGRRGWGAWDGMDIGSFPTFMDIDDGRSVYQLVSELREKARAAKPVV
jgi:hypothetical protein